MSGGASRWKPHQMAIYEMMGWSYYFFVRSTQLVNVSVAAVAIPHYTPHNPFVRQIGHRPLSQPRFLPTAEALRVAAIHQRTGQSLAASATNGFVKGIYRFATHEEMNRHSDEALTRAIAANTRQRARRDGKSEG